MTWRLIGSVSVTPTSGELIVGPVTVPPQGGIEVRVKQTSAPRGFRFAFGLLSFVSPVGRELGVIKVWPDPIATDYRLGAGLSAQSRWGNLTFDARSFNLRWVDAGYPLGISVWADEPGTLPQDRVTPGITDASGRLLQLLRVGQSGRVSF